MAKPEREFTADVGQVSMGVAGPDFIERDFDKLFAMMDPNKTLPTGEEGGIGKNNLQQGAVDDIAIGNREIDDTQSPTGNVGFLSVLFNWIGYMIKRITGKSSWRTAPATTLEAAKTHMDASAPHTGHETPTGAQAKVNVHADNKTNPHTVTALQIGALTSVDGVSNPGGNVDFVAGTGMDITPDVTGKKVTFAAKNESIIPGKHAQTHGSSGTDRITPESIGSETPTGAQTKVNTHEAKTSTHGATSAATVSRIMMRDAYGRAKVAAPSASDDIARLDTVQKMYPVGSIYINASVSTSPATLLGFGTWEAFGSGRVLVGVDTGQTEFATLGKTGGAKTHTLTVNEMPRHYHEIYKKGTTDIGTSVEQIDPIAIMKQPTNFNTQEEGKDAAHNNLQPYITVYMWKRTA